MDRVTSLRSGLRWPLPALLAWGLAWAVFAGLRRADASAAAAAGLMVGGVAAFAWTDRAWRRALIGLGFPVSLLATGLASGLPAALWLVPLGLLLLVYPLRAWRDAPWFPTPRLALTGLHDATGLAGSARVLDAGCGLGDGLIALREALQDALPGARIEGIERSHLLASAARLRCGFARVAVGDMWHASWRDVDLVYLFQRPESMAAAWNKAAAEMRTGSWLASLEFAVPGRRPDAMLERTGARTVWLYRVAASTQSHPATADNPGTALAG